jgi:hypothetical protein
LLVCQKESVAVAAAVEQVACSLASPSLLMLVLVLVPAVVSAALAVLWLVLEQEEAASVALAPSVQAVASEASDLLV